MWIWEILSMSEYLKKLVFCKLKEENIFSMYLWNQGMLSKWPKGIPRVIGSMVNWIAFTSRNGRLSLWLTPYSPRNHSSETWTWPVLQKALIKLHTPRFLPHNANCPPIDRSIQWSIVQAKVEYGSRSVLGSE